MAEIQVPIRKLAPHDPVPGGGRHVVVLRRFDEDDPRRIAIDLIVATGKAEPETIRTTHGVSEVLAEARRIAIDEKLDAIYIIDRLAGPRERDILRHHGDHSVHFGQLDDFDLEEGERGSDMRDRHP
ncbi:MAG: hypothetical protein FWD12_08205 [Alphaproteobacteria bacterium]|nr:hypothetical protein [Alphaproteobacteria bacterium]